jgi:glucose/arabinose dehydrogenase
MIEGQQVVGQEVLLEELGERIRDVRVGPDGYLYLLTDRPDGQLIRLEPAGG